MLKTILSSFFFSLSALYNAQEWVQVGTGITGNVICMEELNGKIYVGGNFTGDLNYMAEYDPSTQLWTDIGNEFITYAVMGMTTYNGKLYVSGLYQWASGDIVAEYDPATGVWNGLGDSNSLSAISELEVYNDVMYVGGNGFSKKATLGSWLWTDMATNNAAQVRGFANVNNELFVHKVNSADSWGEYSMLKYDDASNEFQGLAQETFTYNWFQDLEVVGTDIYCTGSFFIDTDFQRIAVFDTESNTYSALPGGPESAVYTACHHYGKIYFGGSFQSPFNRVVEYTIADGSWASVGSGLNGQVSDLLVLNDTLYAIGNFSTPNHVAKFGIGQVNTTNDLSAVKFNAYPNPCTDQVIIEPRLNEQGLLFDSTGRVISSKRIMNGVIDLSDISSGIYFLKAEEQSEMIKIVKR